MANSKNKKSSKNKEKMARLKKIYEKYMDILNSSKKKQDKIIEKFIKKKDLEEIEKIRTKLNNN